MSHWTKTKVAIKSLAVLKKVAEAKGLIYDDTRKTHTSRFAGKVDTVAVIKGRNGGEIGVCAEGNHYNLIFDSWNNPVAKVIGENAEHLTKDYALEMAKQQAAAMGAVIMGQEIQANGWVELRLSVGGM